MIFIGYLDLVLFALCAFTVVYLLIYAIAATVKRTDKYSESRIKHRFAILIPAYKRALKNYRYFHFIGVVRRHYRAFTRRSGYDVW